jgi:hypothetical protein
MKGSSYISKKPASILGSGRLLVTTLQTSFPGFCVCVTLWDLMKHLGFGDHGLVKIITL